MRHEIEHLIQNMPGELEITLRSPGKYDWYRPNDPRIRMKFRRAHRRFYVRLWGEGWYADVTSPVLSEWPAPRGHPFRVVKIAGSVEKITEDILFLKMLL